MASLEQFWGEGAGVFTVGLKASESVKTSCIELTCELEGEQYLTFLGGKESVGDLFGTDVKIDSFCTFIVLA